MLKTICVCLLSSSVCFASTDVHDKALFLQQDLERVLTQVRGLVGSSSSAMVEFERTNRRCVELEGQLASVRCISTPAPVTIPSLMSHSDYSRIRELTFSVPVSGGYYSRPTRLVHIYERPGTSSSIPLNIDDIVNSNEAYYLQFGVLILENTRLQEESRSKPMVPAGYSYPAAVVSHVSGTRDSYSTGSYSGSGVVGMMGYAVASSSSSDIYEATFNQGSMMRASQVRVKLCLPRRVEDVQVGHLVQSNNNFFTRVETLTSTKEEVDRTLDELRRRNTALERTSVDLSQQLESEKALSSRLTEQLRAAELNDRQSQERFHQIEVEHKRVIEEKNSQIRQQLADAAEEHKRIYAQELARVREEVEGKDKTLRTMEREGKSIVGQLMAQLKEKDTEIFMLRAEKADALRAERKRSDTEFESRLARSEQSARLEAIEDCQARVQDVLRSLCLGEDVQRQIMKTFS